MLEQPRSKAVIHCHISPNYDTLDQKISVHIHAAIQPSLTNLIDINDDINDTIILQKSSGELIENHYDMEDSLNMFFTKIGTELVSNL